MTKAKTIEGLLEQHDRYMEDYEGECDPQWIGEMEAYYTEPTNRARMVSAIRQASGWIPKGLQDHMIAHIRIAVYRMRQARRPQGPSGRKTFGVESVLSGDARRYHTALYNYGLRTNGSLWKQHRSTGRMEALSMAEERENRIKMNAGVQVHRRVNRN